MKVPNNWTLGLRNYFVERLLLHIIKEILITNELENSESYGKNHILMTQN